MRKFLKMLGAVLAGILLLAGCGGGSAATLDHDQAAEQVGAFVSNGKVEYHDAGHNPDNSWAGVDTSADELPPIDKYPLSVQGNGEINVEIFSSTEKSSAKDHRWLDAVAEQFNASGVTVDGKTVSVSVRPIASGLALDYIKSRVYVPTAYSPSNELWGEMINASGVNAQLVEKRLTGNVAGILMKQDTYDNFVAKYGEVTVANAVKASLAGDLKLGHTDPNQSSTGLNILTQELLSFDSSNPVSPEAAKQFQQFQATVPPTSPTTDEMSKVAAKGLMDAMIMESQAVAAQPSLATGWVFTPAGVRHDSPLYALGNPSADQTSVLQQFAAFAKSDANQQLAGTFGFNQYNDYHGVDNTYTGAQLFSALDLWKQNKDAGRPVISVFVVDRSGSMAGEKLARVQLALRTAANYINSDNYVGLVSYSSTGDITVDVPIGQFNDAQHSLFAGAVNDLRADGGTATNSAIYAGLDLMLKQQVNVPNAKLRLLVMSDGQQNEGLDINDAISVVQGLGVPVYGVGFEADLSDLSKLAEPNEGYVINADSDDVVSKLKNLFRAEL
jgi:Ca-activated chloride channel family protein